MKRFSGARIKLAGVVVLAITPVIVLLYFNKQPLLAFIVGLAALVAAWLGGEFFVIQQLRKLTFTARQWGLGDLSTRTGLENAHGAVGDLARAFDNMVASLETRAKEQEEAEKNLLNKSFQQTVIGALGQFALVSTDVSGLFEQTVVMVVQTLGVEYCNIMEALPDGNTMKLRAGSGWKDGSVGATIISAAPGTLPGFTLAAGEPVVITDLAAETRFQPSPFLADHGVASGITVAIAGGGKTFGLLGAHTTHRREFTEDEIHFLLSVATVLAMALDRARTETDLQKLASFARFNPTAALELTADGTIDFFNDAALELTRSIGKEHPREVMPPDILRSLQQCLAAGKNAVRFESRVAARTLSWTLQAVAANDIVHAYVEDITDRLSLEAQLRQAQKMESIGQLAAGVAHDFNNMLTVIQGHAGLLLSRPSLAANSSDSVQSIYFASERAASLTRQLLMFSRKNVIQPKVLDLREVVSNMSKMLERLLGETVRLEFSPPATISMIHADSGMVEQIVMNLAVNARDAMPKGGTLTVGLEDILIDANYVESQPQARAGLFVRLKVTDTGSGMAAETMNHIFEPFFTTKEVGKGTGLGLATVYGIVKQHDGWIEVTSEMGRGSCFSVFLPSSSEKTTEKSIVLHPGAVIPVGKETILVVEDEPVLRDLATLILRECGYRILEASNGVEALKVWDEHHEEIDLVVTDMVMPEGMSGMELAEKLHQTRPDLKLIFASGYSMEELDTTFLTEGYAVFLQKPYTHVTLAHTVRQSLDRKPGAVPPLKLAQPQ